jgi:poly(A) polymerase
MTTAHPALDLATAIVTKLQAQGHVAYFAGGCVRDRIMGRDPADYDVATSARPEQVAALFPGSQLVGAAFGVILVRQRKATVEVATFRTDGQYTDGRRPDTVTFATAQEDAQRRDFTCNGLFYDPVAGQLHDYVGGQADIAAKVLRAIGDPAHRFAEDQLRMLRAVRFAAKLGFQIEPTTFHAIRQFAPRIATVSRERIGDEIRMILEHPSRTEAAALLAATGLLPQIWPAELLPPAIGPWPTVAALPDATPPQGLVAMQLDMARPNLSWEPAAAALRERLMLSNQETDDVQWLGSKQGTLQHWQQLTKAQLKRLIADPRWEQLAALFAATTQPVPDEFTRRVASLMEEGVAPTPFVTGNDLIAMGAQPGKHFKHWLEALYDLQLEGQLASKADAMAKARTLIDGPPSPTPSE